MMMRATSTRRAIPIKRVEATGRAPVGCMPVTAATAAMMTARASHTSQVMDPAYYQEGDVVRHLGELRRETAVPPVLTTRGFTLRPQAVRARQAYPSSGPEECPEYAEHPSSVALRRVRSARRAQSRRRVDARSVPALARIRFGVL